MSSQSLKFAVQDRMCFSNRSSVRPRYATREERNKWLKWGTATGNSSIRDGLNQWYRGRSDD